MSVIDPTSIFEASLHGAARQLIDRGSVSGVRVLHGGRVVTGIACGRNRVYIQYPHVGSSSFDGECNCGARSPCVHIAAVVMTAAEMSLEAIAVRRTAVKETVAAREGASLTAPADRFVPAMAEEPAEAMRQVVCYLIEPAGGESVRLSTWVAQVSAGRIQADAIPFLARKSESKDYPRYVDALDREVLEALTPRKVDGPWKLAGSAGFDLLLRALGTERAFWRSLKNRALSVGTGWRLDFAWRVLPNGDQRLACNTVDAPELLLNLEPAVYIAASGNCGPVEIPYPLDLLRDYWDRPSVDPNRVRMVNASLDKDARADDFPRLRELRLEARVLVTLRAQLVLSAAPHATMSFLYDDKAIESDAPADGDPVRQWGGDVVHEIERDLGRERELRAQLELVLPVIPQDGAAWLAFMITGVPALRSMGWLVSIDADFPYRLAAANDWYADMTTPTPRSQSALPAREWFDLRLGVRVDGNAINLLPALVDYLRGAKGQATGQHDALSLLTDGHLLVRLDDGRYLPVPLARIRRIADTLVELGDQNALSENQALRLPSAQAGRLAQLMMEPSVASSPPLETDAPPLRLVAPTLLSNAPALLGRIAAVHSFSSIAPVPAPVHFPVALRPYQEQGLGWLQFLRRHGLGGILADDMGLGKTVQTLAHLVIEKQQGRLQKPSLIVAPVSVLGNWQQEIRRFAPGLSLVVLQGPKRRDRFASLGSSDIVLIGYPLLLVDGDMLLEHDFSFLILDEAQTIKNPQAKVSQVAQALRAEHRLCLTGTPMENHLGDLWSLFNFVQPGLLGERREFQRLYRAPIEGGGDTRRAAALSRRVQPFLLRRTKDQVARDLPPKMQIVEAIELDELQRDFYDGIRLGQHERVREAIAQQGLARSHLTVLNALLKLRQVCCDPRLVDADAATALIPSAKLEWLSNALPELIAEGRRILLFSQFTTMLGLIETRVRELSIPYCLLTGETRQRDEPVRRFQAGEVPLFLISLKAGGIGLNITAADTVIHYDPWWNPAVEAQATDRAHRIGQDKPVFVYKLIARGTVEEKIMQLQADKHALVTQLYAETSAVSLPLTSADLEGLFAS